MKFLRWRRDVVIGVVAGLVVILFVMAAASMHKVGFPLDDAWIHQTYARNLAEHGQWAFFPGESSAASTSPLYTVVLALGRVLRIPFFIWTFGIGALSLAAAGWIGARLAERLFSNLVPARVGWWTGLALVTTWHLGWAAASGMETMLFATLSLGIVLLAWQDSSHHLWINARQGFVLGVAGALLTLTRPEGVGLVALTWAALALERFQADRREHWRTWTIWSGAVFTGWLVGVLPYLMLNYHIEGTLLPNTSAAKQAEYASLLDLPLWERYVRLLLPILVGGQFLLLPGAVIGIASAVRRALRSSVRWSVLLPAAWAVMNLSAYALRLPASYQHGRYVMPVLPHLLLYAVGGMLIMLRAARHRPWQRIVARTLALSTVGVMGAFLILGARQYGRDVRIINTEMVDSAHWLARNVPPDDLLAVHDIGAVGYYAPRPILDLAGLVSPEIVPLMGDRESLMRLMCERGVVYLMVFPDQRPAKADDPRLGNEWETDPKSGKRVVKPLYHSSAPYVVAEGGDNMMVYRMMWRPDCQ